MSWIVSILEAIYKVASFFGKSEGERLGVAEQKACDLEADVQIAKEKNDVEAANERLSDTIIAAKLCE